MMREQFAEHVGILVDFLSLIEQTNPMFDVLL